MSDGKSELHAGRDDSNSCPIGCTWEDWTTLCILARAWAITAPIGSREREKADCEALIRRIEEAAARHQSLDDVHPGHAEEEAEMTAAAKLRAQGKRPSWNP